MSRVTYSFYDEQTGLFARTSVTCTAAQIAANTPAGYAAVAGLYDPLSQKVDIESAPPVVIDYVPPQPEDTPLATYSWDEVTKRWISAPTLAADKIARKASVQAEIDAIEANDSHQRSLRELMLSIVADEAPPSESVAVLGALDDEIAVLRATLATIDAAATQQELDAIE